MYLNANPQYSLVTGQINGLVLKHQSVPILRFSFLYQKLIFVGALYCACSEHG